MFDGLDGSADDVDAGPFKLTDRFTIHRRLGEGASGIVYEAEDSERRGRVALKRLVAPHPDAIYRFKNEFRSLADVSHPNLVALHELFSVDGLWYFTMDLVQGTTFLAYVREGASRSIAKTMHRTAMRRTTRAVRRGGAFVAEGATLVDAAAGTLDVVLLRDALRQLVSGVMALHATGRLHRDLKPSNVLVTWAGRVVLLDFGLVFQLAGRRAMHDDDLVGTPAYMAPEQASGDEVSPASDWYAVGTMLYEALTGSLPFTGSTSAVLAEKTTREAPDPRDRAPETPDDLAALCTRLLRMDPRERPNGAEIAAIVGSASASAIVETGLVGRERHLATLNDALARVRRGHLVIAHVHGTSGMGKSALVNRFLDDVGFDDDTLILEGRCYERESVPYKALDSLVDALADCVCALPDADASQILPRHTAALARLFPVLRRSLFVDDAVRDAGPQRLEAVELRRRAFGALRDLLTALARRQPLIVYLDDLQWGDKDSASLLLDMIEPPDPPPLLLLASYRSEDKDTSEMVRMLRRRRSSEDDEVREIVVGPLDDGDARAIARSLLPQPADAAELDVIATESGGSPFFVRELAEALRQGVRLEHGKLSLHGVLADRVARLPVDARRLLEVLAVAGRPLPANIAKRAADVSGMEALPLLRASHFVRTRGPRETDEAETFHDRIRETVAGNLAADARSEWHGRIARTLEDAGDADPDALTTHFRAAGDLERAKKYAERAADRAADALAFDRAATLYGIALELASGTEERALRVKLGDALVNAGRGFDSATAYLAAVDGAPPREAMDLQRRAAMLFLMSGHIEEGSEVAARVVRAAGMRWPRTIFGAVVMFVVYRALVWMRGFRFRELDESEVDPDTFFNITCARSVSNGLFIVDIIRAAAFHAQALYDLLREGERYYLSIALAGEIMHSARRGRIARAHAVAKIANDLVARTKIPHSRALCLMAEGWVAYCDARWDECKERGEEALRVLRDECRGVGWEISTTNVLLLLRLSRIGDIKELLRQTPQFVKDAETRGDVFGATTACTSTTFCLLAADEPERALRELDEGMKRWTHASWHMQHALAIVSEGSCGLYLGDVEPARRSIDRAWSGLRNGFVLFDHTVLSALLHLRARLDVVLAGRQKEGRAARLRSAKRDARRLERIALHWGAPGAQLIHGAIAHTNGETARAREHVRSAMEGYARLGMQLNASSARWRLGELVGGAEGRAMRAEAEAWFVAQTIKRPDRFVEIAAPGFASAR